MFSFENDHIFTGYLKQLLSTVNLPTCKIYTKEFLRYLNKTGKEDPRVVESFDPMSNRAFASVNYLKNDEICIYKYDMNSHVTTWQKLSTFHFSPESRVSGLTRSLKSNGNTYDVKTHEYLGDFLRFLRDYYDINLMSMYNCFNNKIYSNIDFSFELEQNGNGDDKKKIKFDSTDPSFRIYAFPVKLFSEYTIAIDCNHGVEVFCGLYKNSLELSDRTANLFNKTYQKIDKAMFNQPFVYDKLTCQFWDFEREVVEGPSGKLAMEENNIITRYDILNRENDLKLFIKVPSTCHSSITVLEGNYSAYNDCIYTPNSNDSDKAKLGWTYTQNRSILNFETISDLDGKLKEDKELKGVQPVNAGGFRPISKLQLLAANTGESYPFADRLVEYLCGSAILPIDGIKDNIRRAQKVMNQNHQFFKTAGLWENKMQKIIYDYLMNAGPIEFNKDKGCLVDKRRGLHPTLGLTRKSSLYDILGYVDKDAEKYYASWIVKDGKAKVHNNIHNVDIYNGLFDI